MWQNDDDDDDDDGNDDDYCQFIKLSRSIKAPQGQRLRKPAHDAKAAAGDHLIISVKLIPDKRHNSYS